MADDQKHSKPRITAETGATTPPYARKSKTTSKRPIPEPHNGNTPKKARYASPADSVTNPQYELSEHQTRGSKGEELRNDLEEDSSDDDQTSIDVEYISNGSSKVEPKQISRQIPNPAQNEIAKIIQQRAIRRLAPASTYPNHLELDRPPIISVFQRYLIQHELADTQQAITFFFNLYDIDVQSGIEKSKGGFDAT